MAFLVPVLIGTTIASLAAPPLISYIGDQTWNKENVENQKKLADAAAFDKQQREQAAKAGYNPYMDAAQQQQTIATQNNSSSSSVMGSMMNMMMMMMMLPMMTNMINAGDDE